MVKPSWIILLLGVAFLGIALMIPSARQVVREGDSVTINYTLTVKGEVVYDSSIGSEPLEVTLGQGTLLPAFEEELIGMRIGDTRHIILPPEKAYGNYRPEMIGTFDRSRLPEGVEPEIGKQIQANLKDGTQVIAVITSFTDTTVTLDANHPLAGQTLNFDVELLGIGNNRTSAAPGRTTMIGWLMLALVAAAAGFLLFKTRHPQPVTAAKRSADIRLKHF